MRRDYSVGFGKVKGPRMTRIGPAVSASDIAAVHALFREYAAALPFSLSYQGFEAELAGLPAPYVPPDGCLLLARRGALCLGTVGLKRLGAGVAEIKRLYVVPEARGGGIGGMLLTRIIDEARAKRYARVRLDSDRRSMAPAIALYRALGFVEIAPYGPDLDGRIAFFEKRLQG
jgi:GNAT superfamily N-acetyltransferase